MQYPPTESINKVIQLKGCALSKPNKYPAIEEKSTLIAKPALVISLKSKKIDFSVNVAEVLNPMVFMKTCAKVVYQKGLDKMFGGFFFRLLRLDLTS